MEGPSSFEQHDHMQGAKDARPTGLMPDGDGLTAANDARWRKLQDMETPSKLRRLLADRPGGRFLTNLILLTRAYDWMDKLWIMTGAALLLLARESAGRAEFMGLSVFFAYQVFGLSYGYALNAWTDRHEDQAAGKDRGTAYFTPRQLWAAIALLGAGLLAIPLSFLRVDLAVLAGVNLFLATSYSCPPFRFKSRGPLGLLVAGVGQRSMGFLFLVLLLPGNQALGVLALVWLAVVGMITEISHQALDYKLDVEAGLRTLAARNTADRVSQLIRALLAMLVLAVLLPLFVFPGFEGLAYCVVLAAFSTYPVHYSMDAMSYIRALAR